MARIIGTEQVVSSRNQFSNSYTARMLQGVKRFKIINYDEIKNMQTNDSLVFKVKINILEDEISNYQSNKNSNKRGKKNN